MKKTGKILATVIAAVMFLAIGVMFTACNNNTEKNLKLFAVSVSTDETDLGFGKLYNQNVDVLELFDDGTYTLTSSSSSFGDWITQYSSDGATVLYGTWTENEGSDEYSLFAKLSAPTRVLSYSKSLAGPTDPVDSDKLTGDERTELLGNYSEKSVEIDYETCTYKVV